MQSPKRITFHAVLRQVLVLVRDILAPHRRHLSLPLTCTLPRFRRTLRRAGRSFSWLGSMSSVGVRCEANYGGDRAGRRELILAVRFRRCCVYNCVLLSWLRHLKCRPL